jgi:hypothetical protein
MAARRQMQTDRVNGRAGANRQANTRSRGRSYRRSDKAKRPWGLISGIVGVVAVFVVVIVVFEATITGGLKQDTTVRAAPASLVSSLVNLPLSTQLAVGGGTDANPPVNIPASYKAATLTSNGLPEIGYVGAEYCPYCALQRWSLIIGLSRFGTWSNLHLIRSSVYETGLASLPTFTFADGAKLSSPYVAFVARELQSNVSINHNGPPYATLQSLPPTLATAFTTIDTSVGYPFMDYGGKTTQVGSQALSSHVAALQGLNWTQVANDLRNPTSTVAQEVLGGANYATAATCMLTNDQPASACNSSVIQALIKKVESSK